MRLSVIGSGYAGMVTAACLASLGHSVTCVDAVKAKVDLVNSGRPPVFEPGLAEMMARSLREGRLRATTDLASAVLGSDASFICVGTPEGGDGSCDLSSVFKVAAEIGKALKAKPEFHVIIVKSTVPPGTSAEVARIIGKESGKKAGKGFGVCMNPEFLKEGGAIADFMAPDRIVIGAEGARELSLAKSLYSNFSAPIIETDLKTAEMIKYASNAFLAAKVSFINEIGNACEKLGIDVYAVAEGMGRDKRIGRLFLNAGAGFGGSCFGKDVKSLSHVAGKAGARTAILDAAISVNDSQPLRVVELLKEGLKELKGKRIAILGLSFKPDTDDMRDAPSVKIINSLLAQGAIITAFDPQAMNNAKKIFGSRLTFAESASSALSGADACAILTEWQEFSGLSAEDFRKMGNPFVVEGRKILKDTKMNGVKYRGIGRIPYG
ncbi:MAG: UDP-glucose/GDP-mannose dehydrogenase family protein [Candidatus ainarchaeum sp.]|nr:UDP-glucose/GDP-mannose dehydrogenase family protein [Candidatus ainarchaeum sp.]